MPRKPQSSIHPVTYAPAASRRRGWVLVVALGAVVAGGILVWWQRPVDAPARPAAAAPAATDEAKPASPAPAVNPVAQRLAGRWLRPDGGYVLELRSPQPGGALEATYFNPRPIHVGRAAWWEKQGSPAVFVELQDTGYPGATYELVYQADRDQLVGTYTQPAAQQTFEVEFTRLGPATGP